MLSSQVYPYPNVALKGHATQSSTLPFAAASKAIDGRRNSYYSQGSCSHTAGSEDNPWWSVELQQSYVVTSVKVTSRGDCCASRLDGAEIRIGDSEKNNGNDNPRFWQYVAFHCSHGAVILPIIEIMKISLGKKKSFRVIIKKKTVQRELKIMLARKLQISHFTCPPLVVYCVNLGSIVWIMLLAKGLIVQCFRPAPSRSH